MNHDVVYSLNLLSLVGTALIAGIAVFSNRFKDNLFQRLGLVIIVLTCSGRVKELILAGADPYAIIYAWKNIGVFLFALGTFIKFSTKDYSRHIEFFKTVTFYERRHAKDRRHLHN